MVRPTPSLRLATLCVVALTLVLAPSGVLAKKKKRRAPMWTQYSVPVSCGTDAAGSVHESTVDVLNSGAADATVLERLVLSNPAGSRSDDLQEVIAAGRASQITCADLLLFTFPPADVPGAPYPNHFQGFLLIDSPVPLTVRATRVLDTGTDVAVVSEAIEGRPIHAVSNDGDVAICHAPPGNPANAHTIYVGASAVPAHLGHGDTQGPCL